MTAGMIHLGDRLGLYRALAIADGPMTTFELAAETALHERWVREWVANQAAARLVEYHPGVDGGVDRFALSGEGRAVLATPEHPAFGMGMFHRLPQTMQALEHMPDCFRTGCGHDYDSHGPEGAEGIERSFEPWMSANLLRKVLPSMDGVVDRLRAGARVVDLGCGAGGAVMMMAEAFPASTFVGYDISQHALDRAGARLSASGLTNARFADPRNEPLPDDHSVDIVTTFDCIHDMSHPSAMIRAIRVGDRRRRPLVARRHPGRRHAGRQHRRQPDGRAAVRRQRPVVHVVGTVGARRRRARHPRPARIEGPADGRRRRLRAVRGARCGASDERVLRGAPMTSPGAGGPWSMPGRFP